MVLFTLDQLSGIGLIRAQRLLQRFGSVATTSEASWDALAGADGRDVVRQKRYSGIYLIRKTAKDRFLEWNRSLYSI